MHGDRVAINDNEPYAGSRTNGATGTQPEGTAAIDRGYGIKQPFTFVVEPAPAPSVPLKHRRKILARKNLVRKLKRRTLYQWDLE